MSVEAKVTCAITTDLIKDYPLKPGQLRFIGGFEEAIVSVRCKEDDLSGIARIYPLTNNYLAAFIVRDERDATPQPVNIKDEITFSGNDTLVIFSPTCEQEIYIHHSSQPEEIVRLKTLQRNSIDRQATRVQKTDSLQPVSTEI